MRNVIKHKDLRVMSKNREATGKRGIYRMSNRLYARMVVPSDVREHFPTGELLKSLDTNDLKVAEYKAAQLFHEWRSQIEKYRGSSTALDEALRWKKILEKERLKDADLLAAFRKQNPDRELTSVDVDDLGIGSNSLAAHSYLENVSRTKGADEAETLANIITGNKLPTLALLEEWTNNLEGKVIPRTIKQHDTRIKTLADKFPALPIKKTDVARWLVELEGENKAEATLKGLIGGCRSYYDYLMRMGHLDPDGINPFERQKFSKKKKASKKDKRQAWEPEDVVKLIDGAKAKTGDANLHDLILLGAFTGARIEELAKLRVEDVREKNGVQYLSIEESKSEAGLRDIPVHKDLVKVVESLVKSSSDGYLLPLEPITTNGERSSAIGKRFGRLKSSLGYDGRLVFHSMRKTLSTLLERQGLHHNQAAEITGHEKVGETYGTYSAGLTIEEKAKLLNKISYVGLKVEPKVGKRVP
jgi:integrase